MCGDVHLDNVVFLLELGGSLDSGTFVELPCRPNCTLPSTDHVVFTLRFVRLRVCRMHRQNES